MVQDNKTDDSCNVSVGVEVTVTESSLVIGEDGTTPWVRGRVRRDVLRKRTNERCTRPLGLCRQGLESQSDLEGRTGSDEEPV